jgi:formylglycine-generating enzyme required for sulfatase activity
MADIFISFKTDDTPRVQAIYDGFRARGLTVFWSNHIQPGAPNYQAIIKDELLKAPVAVVVWTNGSVHSGPVVQECSQAERANKLFQILLDDIEPIDMPMEVKYKAQKTMLLGWTGNPGHPEWIKLNSAIDARLGRMPPIMPDTAGLHPETAPHPNPLPKGEGAKEAALSPKGEAVHGSGSGVPSPHRGEGQGEGALRKPAAGANPPVARPAWASGAGQDEFGRWAEFALGDVRQRVRWIEPGIFTMGSPKSEAGRWDDEGPQHEVTLTRGFWLGDTPVTQALWTAAMGNNPSYFKAPERPVEQVSWDDVQEFLKKMNARISGLGLKLPTEAQWEYACRAGTEGANYARSGETLADIAWFDENSGGETHPVALKRCNDWGLYDMLGNVWEWCADGKRGYAAKPVTDPAGPLDSASRALRGGSWSLYARVARAASRLVYDRGDRLISIGFRCCI